MSDQIIAELRAHKELHSRNCGSAVGPTYCLMCEGIAAIALARKNAIEECLRVVESYEGDGWLDTGEDAANYMAVFIRSLLNTTEGEG